MQESESNGVTLSRAEIYDQATDRWSPTGDVQQPRRLGYTVVLADGSVLIVGGLADFNIHGDTPWCVPMLTSVERFTP